MWGRHADGHERRRAGDAGRRHPSFSPDFGCGGDPEGRLNGFDDAKWHSALAGGFNRFSFGVQSFDTEVRQRRLASTTGRPC